MKEAILQGKVQSQTGNSPSINYKVAYDLASKSYKSQTPGEASLGEASPGLDFTVQGDQLDIKVNSQNTTFSNNCSEKTLTITLRKEDGGTSFTAGEVFRVCADLENKSTQTLESVRFKVEFPECVTFMGNESGGGIGQPNDYGRMTKFFSYDNSTRIASNLCDGRDYRYNDCGNQWGIALGPNWKVPVCFNVKANTDKTAVLKAEIVAVDSFLGTNHNEFLPNNGSTATNSLTLNQNGNYLTVSTKELNIANTASTEAIVINSNNQNWTSLQDDSWISLTKTATGATISFQENKSVKSRYGTIKITDASACGLDKIIHVKQAGNADCPSVALSANTPLCGEVLNVTAKVVAANQKDLVGNGDFEEGNSSFGSGETSPGEMRLFDGESTGGTKSYTVTDSPKDVMTFLPSNCSANPGNKQLLVSASWSNNAIFWSQNINIEPNTNYTFSLKGIQLGGGVGLPVSLNLLANGKETGISSTLQSCNWSEMTGTWNSGSTAGSVTFSLNFNNPGGSSKQFSIDDISLKANSSNGEKTSANPVTYAWQGGTLATTDPMAQQDALTFKDVKAANAGVYTLTVTQNDCPVKETIKVKVYCPPSTCPAPSIEAPRWQCNMCQ